MLKAAEIVKYYKKATDFPVSVLDPDWENENNYHIVCDRCTERKCKRVHADAVSKARTLGGSYIYLCDEDYVFWTSPFYCGERLAGSLLCGGVIRKTRQSSPHEAYEDSEKVKSLAQLLLLCTNKISGMSFVQKNAVYNLSDNNSAQSLEENSKDNKFKEKKKNKDSNENYFDPIEMERLLLASLRRGDNTEAQKILIKLLEVLFADNNKMAAFKHRAMELAVLLSRAAADPKDVINNSALETTNRCFMQIEGSATYGEIVDILSAITERMAGMIFSFHGVRHFSALRKAERYIWSNYTRKLSLHEIAKASGLSAPYFSTVFKEEMGENLSNYLNRLRVEKAAIMLVTTDVPISGVAFACGFEDQSWFSKIFKNNMGFTPGKYRERGINTSGTLAGA
jgi:YesN/AraC family two-component response regulator